MLKLKNILKKLAKASLLKKAIVITGLVAVLAPATLAVWGPERPSFDYNDPIGRQGSMTGPVFNSMKNTPTYGDEFNFTTARKTGEATWSNDLKVKAGDEVEIRVYIHNNANTGTNESGLGIATNVKAGVDIPLEQFGTKNEPIGFVNAANSKPLEVFDGTMISSADGKKFKLSYITGSSQITQRDGSGTAKATLSDNFATKNGTPVGSQPGSASNGRWLGCYEHVGWVITKVKVVGETAPAPAVEIEKTTPSGKVNVNDEFPYTVKVTNTGNVDLTDVKVDDPAPANVTFSRVEPSTGITFDFSPSRVKATIASLKIGESKSFVIIAKVTKYVPTQIINTACVNAKEVNPEEPEKNDDCDDVPVTPSEYCIVPGKEHLPKDDERCKVVLPSTGPGSTLLMIVATVALATGAYLTSLKLAKRKS